MSPTRILWPLTAVLVVLALAGCVPAVEMQAVPGFRPASGDSFVLGSYTFTEVGTDPLVFAQGFPADPLGFRVVGSSGFVGPGPQDYSQRAMVQSTPSAGTKTIGAAAIVGLGDATTDCTATGGTVTVAALGTVGTAVTGTISVASWSQAGPSACPPTPTAGSFSATREADDNYGNNGSGLDTFAFTPTGGDPAVTGTPTYTENNVTLYDPLIFAEWNSADSFPLRIQLLAGWNALAGAYDFEMGMHLIDALTGLHGNPNNFLQIERYNGVVMSNCGTGTQSITVTGTGAPGSFVVGTFNTTSMSGAGGCPSAVSGSFNALREADH